MKWRDITVMSISTGGDQIPAKLGSCNFCGCEEFMVYIVGNQQHPHMQCLNCGECFCSLPGGCKTDPGYEEKETQRQ